MVGSGGGEKGSRGEGSSPAATPPRQQRGRRQFFLSSHSRSSQPTHFAEEREKKKYRGEELSELGIEESLSPPPLSASSQNQLGREGEKVLFLLEGRARKGGGVSNFV